MIALPDYTNTEHDIRRAIERWENEGGWSSYAGFMKARERENNGARQPGEAAAVAARPSPAGDRRVAQGA